MEKESQTLKSEGKERERERRESLGRRYRNVERESLREILMMPSTRSFQFFQKKKKVKN